MIRCRTIFSILVASVLIATACLQAASLRGKVVDPAGRPIPGVNISIDGGKIGAVTDEQGNFQLDAEGPGGHDLTFTHVGFQPRMVKAFEQSNLSVELQPSVYPGQGITVTASRAEAGVSPVAFSDFTGQEIERDYSIGEFPLLLETTPNLYAYADAGGGLGYSYIRIRGFDDKRVSTYINGVPLNDPEDQATYFVDIPDFASNVKDIQVQRGIGNSLYGDASFGGSVNIVSAGIEQERSIALSTGYGGFWSDGEWVGDMEKQSLEYNSGLIDGRWNFSGRYSRQLSDGYRKDSWYDGWSYYLSLARLDPNMTTTVNIYGGPMQMHLAYYGISREQIDEDRRFNPLTYANETDNFNQPHYEVHNVIRLAENLSLDNTLFHIHGSGYYEQYDSDQQFYDFSIPPTEITNAEGEVVSVITSGDIVKQQHVSKNQWGWNPRLDLQQESGELNIGGQFYYFESDHWGQVTWAEGVTNQIDPQHKYYQYFGEKYFAAAYVNKNYRLNDRLQFHGNLQFRYQTYNFDQVEMGPYSGYNFDVDWAFLSPRVGMNYRVARNTNLILSYSLSSRAPADYEIYDANDPYALPSLEIDDIRFAAQNDSTVIFGDPTMKAERVHDFELGAEYRDSDATYGANLFWMEFRNEIVPFGGLSDLGLPITTNVDRSVHAGIELSAARKLSSRIRLSGNVSYNYNRIKEFEVVETVYDNPDDYGYVGSETFSYADKTITGFPEYIGNAVAEYNSDLIQLALRGRFIGKIYVENANVEELAIDPYFISSVTGKLNLGSLSNLGTLQLSINLNNIFNEKYEYFGYGGAVRFRDAADIFWAEYTPAAERSIFTELSLRLR